MSLMQAISAALLAGKKRDVEALVRQAIDEGLGAQQILDEALLPPMDLIGTRFSAGEVFVPEMMVSARAMNAGMSLLKPLLREEDAGGIGKAIIGTVKGDMHDIGKNLVKMMIEAKGIEVVDLGVDVSAQTFIDTIDAHPDASLVCLSTLLTTTMPAMRETVAALTKAGVRSQVKVMVGGAPVTAEFAAEIGADAYTPDAGSAAAKAMELV